MEEQANIRRQNTCQSCFKEKNKHIKYVNFISISIFFLIILFSSCKKENFYNGNEKVLRFSTDTVQFDTVFTTIGSATQWFIVYNTQNQPLKINSIRLAKGNQSFFRLNINGISTRELKDIELDAQDSMFIFVEVKVDPTNTNNPMVVQDSIQFFFNNVMQDIDLVAYGQDVHLINGEIISQNQNWIADKPYLIYNSMLVDSNVTLSISAGAKLYFHHRSRMYIKGTLIANGSLQEPIIFRGDRLEHWYDKLPGQWDGIYFVMGSKDNIMNYCEIRNAIIGIQVDTLASLNQPTLTLSNSKILNMNAAGLFAQGSTVKAWNCVFANCGQFAIALTIGGSYEFYHCTLYNTWYYNNRQTPSLWLNNYYKDINGNYQVRPLEQATFANCIIYGNKETEIIIDEFPSSPIFNYEFKNCLIKAGNDLNTSNTNRWINIFKNELPQLKDPTNEKFELDTLSFCINKGDLNIGSMFPWDYNGNSRIIDNMPDLGAFEHP
ncbi:MAG: hypothetical protein HPY79_02540 [Bacteroidales bacterium]|nr:hypothetical protein [Bacteroidales bacterium]